MDDNGQRENGRHKADAYNKSLHAQWMMPPHQMKDPHTLKLMTLMAERDKAIQERNMAITEKRAALAERDIAFLHRDAAIAERNNAIMERDNAVATLEYARENGVNSSSGTGCASPHSGKHIHHHHLHQQQQQHVQHLHLQPSDLSESPYHPSREMHISEAYPISVNSEGAVKLRKGKRPKKETQATPTKKTPRSTRKSKKGGGEDLNKQIKVPKQQSEWRDEAEDLNGQAGATKSNEWKGQELGLNVVTFDDSTMPVPVCSCTGKYQQCYKWGNGGWQSACCTTTLSMYPLPVMENKRHARVGGRKMSGGVFTKLLSRLAAEGHDMSIPLDLKDHWAKHGTNRYITIK